MCSLKVNFGKFYGHLTTLSAKSIDNTETETFLDGNCQGMDFPDTIKSQSLVSTCT